jgi:hypothetical protein
MTTQQKTKIMVNKKSVAMTTLWLGVAAHQLYSGYQLITSQDPTVFIAGVVSFGLGGFVVLTHFFMAHK